MKQETFLPTKKIYHSKINLIFAFIASVGGLVINDPLIISEVDPKILGYVTSIIGTLGVITRTFFTSSTIEP